LTDIAAAAPERAKLDIGRSIGRIFAVLRRRGLILFLLGLLTLGIVNSIFVTLRHAGILVPPPGDLGAFRGAPGENIAVGLVTAFFYGGAIAAALSWLRDRPFALGDGLTTSTRHFGRMVGISILSNIAIVIGLILFIVPGILLWTRWFAAQAVAVAENQGVTESMGRSAALTENCRFAIFVIGLVSFLIALVLAMLVGLPLYLLGQAAGAGELIADYVGEFAGLFAVAVFDSAAKAVVYDELVRVKEGGPRDQVSEVFA
jgi:hypothetical protein